MAKKKRFPMSRSEIMSKVKGSDTSIELKLRKELWARGYRYRVNCRGVAGTPDICFKSRKIAIFCDSEFWHGKLYQEGKSIPKTNQNFWIEKIKRNIKRDQEVNEKLEEEGWIVLRFWQKDIEKRLENCIGNIVVVLENRFL